MSEEDLSDRVFFPTLVDSLYDRGIQPNQITVLGLVCSLIAASLVASSVRNPYALSLASVFVALALLADALDGDLARTHDLDSDAGAFFDFTSDKVSDILVYGSLTWVCSVPLFGFAAIAGDLLISGISAKYEALSGNYVKAGIGSRGGGHVFLAVAVCATPVAATVLEASVAAVLSGVLLVLAIMKYVTVVQRLRRIYPDLD